MAYYIRKPELVEAIQWTGSNIQEIKDFVGTEAEVYQDPDFEGSTILSVHRWRKGICTLLSGDYLIKHDFSDNPDLFPFQMMKENLI